MVKSLEPGNDEVLSLLDVQTERGDSKLQLSINPVILPNGNLQHYDWKETAPEKSQSSVEYKDQFLVQLLSFGAEL